jgi:hypothetical protein
MSRGVAAMRFRRARLARARRVPVLRVLAVAADPSNRNPASWTLVR